MRNGTMRRGCETCRVSLESWCREGAARKLCGLCDLMGPDLLARYIEVWDPPPVAVAAGKREDAE